MSPGFVDNIIESMMDALLVVSPDGMIMRLNASACSLLGYPEQELIGMPLGTVLPDGPLAGTSALDDVLAKGSVHIVERWLRTRSGRRVPVRFSASVIHDGRDAIEGVVCVAHDISAQKEAEDRLRAFSEELQETNAELRNFAFIVSHDLRAPLVNIKGFSEELQLGIKALRILFQKHLDAFSAEERKTIAAVLSDDIPEALGFIGSSVSRMDGLITAVLRVSRTERRRLNPERLSVRDVVRTVLDSLAHQIESRGAVVTVGPLPDVTADQTALEQIFGNLLDNAVKYLDPSRPGTIEVSAESSPHETVFHVRDNGRGMAPRDVPRAFELFRRLGRQDVPGEGMGLVCAKTLVRAQGGRIWAESREGAGSVFSFTLPRSAEGGAAAAKDA